MATEIVTKQWCDVHLREDDDRVEAVWMEDVRIGSVTRHLDLCEQHYAKLIGDLAEDLERYGSPLESRTEARPQSSTRDEMCPVCQGVYPFKSLSAHTRKRHGITLTELRSQQPFKANSAQSWPCDQCDMVASGAQGLGAHKRAMHGIEGRSPSSVQWREEHNTPDPEPVLTSG